MKLRYHAEVVRSEVGINKNKFKPSEGILILESEPQMRTIFIHSQCRDRVRLPFPYTLFLLKYQRTSTGKYKYIGVYGNGLRVFGSLKPLSSMQDKIFLLPTDIERSGSVCTNHSYDNKEYDSLFEMTSEILSLWFGHVHFINANYAEKAYNDLAVKRGLKVTIEQWENSQLDQLDKIEWTKFGYNSKVAPTGEFLEVVKSDAYIMPVDKVEFTDEQWSRAIDEKCN